MGCCGSSVGSSPRKQAASKPLATKSSEYVDISKDVPNQFAEIKEKNRLSHCPFGDVSSCDDNDKSSVDSDISFTYAGLCGESTDFHSFDDVDTESSAPATPVSQTLPSEGENSTTSLRHSPSATFYHKSLNEGSDWVNSDSFGATSIRIPILDIGSTRRSRFIRNYSKEFYNTSPEKQVSYKGKVAAGQNNDSFVTPRSVYTSSSSSSSDSSSSRSSIELAETCSIISDDDSISAIYSEGEMSEMSPASGVNECSIASSPY